MPTLGRPTPAQGAIIAQASSHLPGNIDSRPYSAIDGDPTTAWTTGFGPQPGNWIDFTTPHPITLDHMDLTVVADGQHSVPTQIQVNVNGQAPGQVVTLPPITDGKAPGSTVTVHVPLTRVTGTDIRLTVVSVRAESTINYFNKVSQDLPIGIAELGIPGLDQAQPTGPLPAGAAATCSASTASPCRCG